ncbi:3-oxoacyl-[acyl-carrier protein] reductase [Anaerovirgula multivorans]|uniref:3-oxoacyl-[acyl-carrier protein] reductase n=1 Tax=Anaerovirgula multivorans TaxID=312168 RepID=A0A239J696_9FIRM|nr:SDR family oxidoreductase [Anaerovirgula multivorans]SNT01350.1 3-oxoacyl-[acyl-carrier protein] reductase [Anaerovirgula multivorans]
MDFNLKTVVITSWIKEIGRSISLALAREGANLAILCDTNDDEISTIVKEVKQFDTQIMIIQTNLADPEDVKKNMEEVYKVFGKIDILINFVPVEAEGEIFENLSYQNFEQNAILPTKMIFNCCKAAVQYLLKNEYGKIINLVNLGQCMAELGKSGSSTLRESIWGITKNLGKELAGKKITVNVVEAHYIPGGLTYASESLNDFSYKARSKADDFTGSVLFLASSKSNYITGQLIIVDGGLEAKNKVRCL